jgi:pyruvate,orthophosphate dikinase
VSCIIELQEGRIHYLGGRSLAVEESAKIEEVGSKAFNLIQMARAGLPIPPGFVIGASFCCEYFDNNKTIPSSIGKLVAENIGKLEQETGLAFGGQRRPLLVSVRSGAAVSMPGMMDTILNIGLNDTTVASMIRMTGNPHFVWDSYRRLIESFANIVYNSPKEPFENVLNEQMQEEDLRDIGEMDSSQLRNLARRYLEVFQEQTETPFPQKPLEQLENAIGAVFRSWESPRATEYRRIHKITGLGTAVTIQTMIFGNMGGTSGSGVAFTRDPVGGENQIYMDFLFNAQGEDVVSGRQHDNHAERIRHVLPSIYNEILLVSKKLELEFKDMQDFEFTIQEGRLYILQCRNGKRTPWAALKIAVDFVNEGVIDQETALRRLKQYDLDSIILTKLGGAGASVLASGLGVNWGIATGEVVFNSETAQKKAKAGRSVILIRDDTATADIGGMVASKGMLTRLGGRTSHAAVVARQMDKVCIVGCKALSIDNKGKKCTLGGKTLSEGDMISLDGSTGQVYAGKVDIITEKPLQLLEIIKRWRNDQR